MFWLLLCVGALIDCCDATTMNAVDYVYVLKIFSDISELVCAIGMRVCLIVGSACRLPDQRL